MLLLSKMKKKKTKEKISLNTGYGKAIIRKIIMDRDYQGDIEKLKTHSNIDRHGNPKKLRDRTTGEEHDNVVAYYYKDGNVDLITVSDYTDCVNEDRRNQLSHPELAIKVEKKKREYREPIFIPEVGSIYVGSSYYLDSDCLIIITGKTPKQFKYEPVIHSYKPTECEERYGYRKTIEELIENGYKISDLLGERKLKLSVDGSWINGNFSINQSDEYKAEGLLEKMSR